MILKHSKQEKVYTFAIEIEKQRYPRKQHIMKKAYTLLISLFLALGVAKGQDVYFAGNSNGIGKIWKNDSLVIGLSDSLLIDMKSMQVGSDSSIFSVGMVHDSAYSFVFGRVWLNDSVVFAADTNTVVNALVLNGNGWTAAGIGENEWGGVAGLMWQNGELVYAYGDSIVDYSLDVLAYDSLTGDLYIGGCVTDSIGQQATVWKNDAIFWQADYGSSISGLAHDGTDLYAAGFFVLEGLVSAALWQNDSIVFSVGDLEHEAMFTALAFHDSSIYLAGHFCDSLIVWQDGEVLFCHPYSDVSEINALVVNEFGVYYAGKFDGVATVWKDGEILYQPEGCESIVALAVLPTLPPPPLPEYALTVAANDTLWGIVSGGGIYHEGDTATIEAFANTGCEFLYWNDSITDNPRDIIVTQDSSFVAHFALIDYLIETSVSPEGAGVVSGGGLYHYGDTLTLEALPNLGFVFAGWNDSIADNPRDIIVLGDSTFTALFDTLRCTVSTIVMPEGAGTVSGGGTYTYGTTIQLEATALDGHDFLQWADGIADNPRTVVVECDTVFAAEFSTYQYEIVTEVTPENGGLVTGGGIYDHGSTATLTAIPNEGYSFVCWHDGIISNPRSIIVTQEGFYKALFSQDALPQYTVEVASSDTTLGTVGGGGIFEEGSVALVTARPKDHAYFKQWDDGNTDNPRQLVVDRDLRLTALFEAKPTYTIRVMTDNPAMGSVYGSGTFNEGVNVTIGALPNEGYHFAGWNDGVMSNPRIIEVVENMVFTAFFAEIPVTVYSVSVTCDESQGFILGASEGSYAEGSTITIAAINADGYRFKQWSDGNTDNPRQIVVDHDIRLFAQFESVGIGENLAGNLRLYPNPTFGVVRIEGLEGEAELEVTDAMGTTVRHFRIAGDATLDLGGLPAGFYVVRVGRHYAKFVKM